MNPSPESAPAPVEPVFMHGKTMYLRPLLRRDIRPEYLAWLNNPEMTVYSSLRNWPTSEKDLDDFFANLRGPNHVVFAGCCAKTHVHFGNFSLSHIDWVNRRAEAALMIGLPQFRTTHYVEGIQLLARYAFQILNLNKLIGGSEIPSVPPLLERLGWKREGLLRQHNYRAGAYVDVVQMALLRADSEWK